MVKTESLSDGKRDKFNISRRGFVKSSMALGAAAALVGCSKNDGETIYLGGGVIPL